MRKTGTGSSAANTTPPPLPSASRPVATPFAAASAGRVPPPALNRPAPSGPAPAPDAEEWGAPTITKVAAPPPPSAVTRPPIASDNRPTVGGTMSVFGASRTAPRPVTAPSLSASAPSPIAPPRAPVAPAPAPVVVSNEPTKPDEDDRIGPVGTAYTPIKLQPKKLVNPFAAREAAALKEQEEVARGPSVKDRSTAFGESRLEHRFPAWVSPL